MIFLSLALAGLTYWLRLQVVTYISGRSFSDILREESLDSLLSNLASNLDNFGELSSFGINDDRDSSKFGYQCHINFGVCLSSAFMMALRERAVTEMDILTSLPFLMGNLQSRSSHQMRGIAGRIPPLQNEQKQAHHSRSNHHQHQPTLYGKQKI